MKILDLQLRKYSLSFKKPLKIKGHTQAYKEGFVLELKSSDNHSIFTDISPLRGLHLESCDEIKRAFPALKKALNNSYWSLKLLLSNSNTLNDFFAHYDFPSLRFATEMGLLSHLMPKLNHFVAHPIQALLSGGDEELIARSKYLLPHQSVKLKVGSRSPSQMLSLIEKLTPFLGDRLLKIDVNRSWSLDDTLHFCSQFPPHRCEYLEEPIDNTLHLLDLSSEFTHPIAFDESLFDTPLDFLLSIPTKKAFVIKPSLFGSLQKIHNLYSRALLHRMQFVLSSCYESGLGLLMIAQLAHYLALKEPLGLDTYHTLNQDILSVALDLSKGEINLEKNSFLTPYIDFEKLKLPYATQ